MRTYEVVLRFSVETGNDVEIDLVEKLIRHGFVKNHLSSVIPRMKATRFFVEVEKKNENQEH